MVDLPAVNASPLILLSRAGLLDLLCLLAPRVVVPRPVADEIARYGEADATARALRECLWIDVVEAPPVSAVLQAWDLGPGETSVLAWAQARPGTEAILDDLAARRCAASLSIPVRGTLGLVLLAKRMGRLVTARAAVEQLRLGGLYLTDDVMNTALRLVDE